MECGVIATLTDEHSCQRKASLGRRGLQVILELRVFTSCIKRNIQRLECKVWECDCPSPSENIFPIYEIRSY
jgi:hypothetical protein